MSEKTVFIKTVREDGRSLYARGPLCRTYEIGKRYTFPKGLPAHVGCRLSLYGNLTNAYVGRPEAYGGNRLLLCLGQTKNQNVPVIQIDVPFWKISWFYQHKNNRITCDDFEVIGEIFMPHAHPDDWEDDTVRGYVAMDAQVFESPLRDQVEPIDFETLFAND